MIAVEDTVLVLLAAGRSKRFGDVGSKLDEEFLHKPLGAHVAVTLGAMPFARRLAVVGGARIDYSTHGFEIVHNDAPGEGMSRSVRLGVARAKEQGAAAVLLALADMPRVTAAHILRLFDASGGPETVVASSDGCEPKPPALFGRDRFDFLLSLHGDEGARDLVAAGKHVVTSPAELIDVDTQGELDQLRALLHTPERLATRSPTPPATRAGGHRSG